MPLQEPGNEAGTTSSSDRNVMVRRVVLSSYLGSVIEWFDFYLYGVATALVFNTLFFPQLSAASGIIASFGTFAVGYFARPLGGIIYGHFGDRVGRKKMLVTSILMMGVATVGVGLMPTYAQIGIMAPVLLVIIRLVQGVAAGGEWGGAVLMSMEHTSHRRRGLWTSFTMTGNPTGITLATGSFALVQLMPEEQFLAWGWRLPFLLSVVLVAMALWIRVGVEESPVFKEALREQERAGKNERAPLIEVIRNEPRATLLGILAIVGPFTFGTVMVTFGVTYATAVGFSKGTATNALLVASLVGIAAIVGWGSVSDRFGRRQVYLVGTIALCVASFVTFWMINTTALVMLVLALCLAKATHAVCYGPMGAFLGELFTTRTRYTGISLGYQVGGVIGGGLGPFLASVLLAVGGGSDNMLISIYLAGGCALSFVATLLARTRPDAAPSSDAQVGATQQTSTTEA